MKTFLAFIGTLLCVAFTFVAVFGWIAQTYDNWAYIRPVLSFISGPLLIVAGVESTRWMFKKATRL